MKIRHLGNGIAVSAIGFGCMGMDHAYGAPAPREAMKSLLHDVLDVGCNFFDTAVVYGENNERVLGDAFHDRRDRVVLATKFGIVGQRVVDGKPQNILDSRPETLRTQLEGSLRRLKTDYIDLYYQHRVDPQVPPEAVAEVMARFIDEGKIRAWGLSNPPLDYLKRAHAICPIAALENQYSPLWRAPEADVFPLCEELGIAFVAYSPLGNGFLSGRFNAESTYEKGDFRASMARFSPAVMAKNQALLTLFQTLAAEKGATTAQVVLAWELAQKPYLIPIPGTTKVERAKENLAAVELELTADDLSRMAAALTDTPVDTSYF